MSDAINITESNGEKTSHLTFIVACHCVPGIASLVIRAGSFCLLPYRHGPLNFLSSETVESVLIVEALDETNRSKLLSCDTVAFDSLVESLFPAVDIPQMEDKLLEVCAACASSGICIRYF